MLQTEFLSYLTTEKRYSIHTVSGYETDLRQFTLYCQEEYDLSDLTQATHQLIRSWMVSLIDQGLTTRSVNRKLSTLRTYYKFLRRQRKMEKDPMSKIQAPKTSKRLPVFVEEKAMENLLSVIVFDDGFMGLRDKLMVTLFYETGIRLSELIGLRDADLNPYDHVLKVLGKRNKERLIPVSTSLKEFIFTYMQQRDAEFGPDQSEYLLVSNKGQKLNPGVVRRTVNKYLSQVTTIEKKSPHVLRHTFATHMLNNGASLNAVKEILGHANLAATQVYTHNTIEKLKNIHELTHPRG